MWPPASICLGNQRNNPDYRATGGRSALPISRKVSGTQCRNPCGRPGTSEAHVHPGSMRWSRWCQGLRRGRGAGAAPPGRATRITLRRTTGRPSSVSSASMAGARTCAGGASASAGGSGGMVNVLSNAKTRSPRSMLRSRTQITSGVCRMVNSSARRLRTKPDARSSARMVD